VTAGICYPLWALLFARFLLSGRANPTQRAPLTGGTRRHYAGVRGPGYGRPGCLYRWFLQAALYGAWPCRTVSPYHLPPRLRPQHPPGRRLPGAHV